MFLSLWGGHNDFRLRNYGITDLPPSLPLPRADPVTRIRESKRGRNGRFDRCHAPDILADLTAIGARAPQRISEQAAARSSCSVSSTFSRPLCRDHRWQSDIEIDVGLPAAVDGQTTAATSSYRFSCKFDAAQR